VRSLCKRNCRVPSIQNMSSWEHLLPSCRQSQGFAVPRTDDNSSTGIRSAFHFTPAMLYAILVGQRCRNQTGGKRKSFAQCRRWWDRLKHGPADVEMGRGLLAGSNLFSQLQTARFSPCRSAHSGSLRSRTCLHPNTRCIQRFQRAFNAQLGPAQVADQVCPGPARPLNSK
jgi:hypothetical protein